MCCRQKTKVSKFSLGLDTDNQSSKGGGGNANLAVVMETWATGSETNRVAFTAVTCDSLPIQQSTWNRNRTCLVGISTVCLGCGSSALESLAKFMAFFLQPFVVFHTCLFQIVHEFFMLVLPNFNIESAPQGLLVATDKPQTWQRVCQWCWSLSFLH